MSAVAMSAVAMSAVATSAVAMSEDHHKPGSGPPHEPPSPWPDPTSVPALEAALEDGCGALLALEASRASIASVMQGVGSAEADVTGAIDSLRRAIEELHVLIVGDEPSQLALGFVLRQPTDPSG